MYVPKQEGEGVLARVDGEWQYGNWTGESGKWDEHFVVRLTDATRTVRLHYEDIREP